MTHYCQFDVVSETRDGLVEICRTCKRRLTTKKNKKGQVDNIQWLKEHVADTAQPKGATEKIFKQLYGTP